MVAFTTIVTPILLRRSFKGYRGETDAEIEAVHGERH